VYLLVGLLALQAARLADARRFDGT
jgi:hypothetical protein